MIDWMNPTHEMMVGRTAGRHDRQNEIDELEAAMIEAGEKDDAIRTALQNLIDATPRIGPPCNCITCVAWYAADKLLRGTDAT